MHHLNLPQMKVNNPATKAYRQYLVSRQNYVFITTITVSNCFATFYLKAVNCMVLNLLFIIFIDSSTFLMMYCVSALSISSAFSRSKTFCSRLRKKFVVVKTLWHR
jgi:hypothetical protein